MGIMAEKTLDESKHQTTITTFLTGEAVSPTTGHIAIYTDITAADAHRALEIQEKLRTLFNRAMEENYRRPSSGAIYWAVPIDGSKADIHVLGIISNLLPGEVAIGMSGNVRGGSRGSTILNAAYKRVLEWMNENDRLAV